MQVSAPKSSLTQIIQGPLIHLPYPKIHGGGQCQRKVPAKCHEGSFLRHSAPTRRIALYKQFIRPNMGSLQRTQPLGLLWCALNPSPSPLKDSDAPPEGAHRRSGTAVLPCNQRGRKSLQPPPPSHHNQEKLSATSQPLDFRHSSQVLGT